MNIGSKTVMADDTDTDTTSSTGKQHSSQDAAAAAAATADGDVVMGNVSKANTDTETEDNESDTMEMNPNATTQEAADKENQDEPQMQSSSSKPILNNKTTPDPPLPVPLDHHLSQPAGVEEEDANNNDVGVPEKEELKKNNYPTTSLTIDTNNDDDDDEPRANNYSVSGGGVANKLMMDSSELHGGRVMEAGLVGMDEPQLVGNKLLMDVGNEGELKTPANSFLLEPNASEAEEPGTDEEQAAFMKELEVFHKENYLEFKPPKFYGEPLNCLKLWRSVIRLGGYEQVTSCKLWRQVGESFKPPKTCTTVSWTFRCFYEKALLEYEKYKMRIGELPFTDAFTEPAPLGHQTSLTLASGSGRARRDAAARAMQGWHSQRLLGNGEVGDPIIKDKNSSSMLKREKQFKSIGILKRKKPSSVERAVKVARMKASKAQLNSMVVDVGLPADWVKINVQKTKDCFEVYALVPGLLREEVRVQSDPAGRLVITGQPEQLDNPWGVTPFKKVVSLPSRIDPQTTSAVVTLHGQLFVRVPFEQPD